MKEIFVIPLLLLAAQPALAEDGDALVRLLQTGPIAQVHRDADGKFKMAEGIAVVEAPPQRTYEVIIDVPNFAKFMPQTETVKVVNQGPDFIDAEVELDVPVFSYEYTMRHKFDPAHLSMQADWLEGDGEGNSAHTWAEPCPGHPEWTLLHYTTRAELPGVITTFEDDQMVLTIGVNASTVLGVVQAIKRETEKRFKEAPPVIAPMPAGEPEAKPQTNP